MHKNKIIFYALPFISFIFSSKAFSINNTKKNCENVCKIQRCTKEATFYKWVMNLEVSPCESFYDFACGGHTKYVLNRGHSYHSIAYNTHKLPILHELFAKISAINSSDFHAFKILRRYHENCINETRVNEDGIKPVKKIFEIFGGWPLILGNKYNESNFKWMDAILNISHVAEIFFPFVPQIDIDFNDQRKFSLNLHKAYTSAGYVRSENKSLSYKNLIQDVAIFFGAKNDSNLIDEIKEMTSFENELYILQQQKYRGSTQVNFKSIHRLTERFPSVEWLTILNGLFNPVGVTIDSSDLMLISVLDPIFINNFKTFMKNWPKRVVANYLAWNLVYLNSQYMPEPIRSKILRFRNIDDLRLESDRKSACYFDTIFKDGLALSVGALYARQSFSLEKTIGVTKMTNFIKQHIIHSFNQTDWMDNKTRTIAIEKLEAMTATIGFDTELLDESKIQEFYSSLDIKNESYFTTGMKVKLNSVRQKYKVLKKPTKFHKWMLRSYQYEINAKADSIENRIAILAGSVNTLFKPDRPQYLNYGELGATVAHEIYHHFSPSMKGIDKSGAIDTWKWETETEKLYDEKLACFIEQYNNFTVEVSDPENHSEIRILNKGNQTLNENLSDNGGYKAAYHTYNKWAAENNVTEECLSSLPFTPRQMFWISAAGVYCELYDYESTRSKYDADSHAPSRARVDISFSNIKEFAEDFDCKVGSKMNPRDKCVLW